MSFDKKMTCKGITKRWTYVFKSPDLKAEAEQEYKNIKEIQPATPNSQEKFIELTNKIDVAMRLLFKKDKDSKTTHPVSKERDEEEENDSLDSNASGGSDQFSMPKQDCTFNIHCMEVPPYERMKLFVRTKFDFSHIEKGYEKLRKRKEPKFDSAGKKNERDIRACPSSASFRRYH
jgi:hypothetical protein